MKKSQQNSLNDEIFYKQQLETAQTSPTGLTFANTSISVFRIGSMLANGETKAKILSDYPDLTIDDLKFARMHYFKQLNVRLDNNSTLDKLMQMGNKQND